VIVGKSFEKEFERTLKAKASYKKLEDATKRHETYIKERLDGAKGSPKAKFIERHQIVQEKRAKEEINEIRKTKRETARL